MSEELLKDIAARLESIGETVSEERIRAIVGEEVAKLQPAGERKMRFGGESKLVGSKFARWNLSAADVEFLYDMQKSLEGQRRVNGAGVYEGPSEELRNAFDEISDAQYISQERIREIDRQAIDDLFPRVTKRNRAAYEAAMRAMDTAESGYGSSLVGAQYVGDLWEGARPESRIFSLLNTFEMTAPTAYLPVEADLPEMYFVGENTAATASDYSTSKSGSNRASTTAAKFIIHQMWSGEMEEDSIIPFIPFLRRQAQLSLAHYSDSTVLNGDTTNAATNNINLVDADPADTKHYLAFDGIRHAALVDNTGNAVSHAGAAITLDALFGMKKLMLDRTYLMDWGHPTMASDLVYVVPPELGDKIAMLDEVLTVEKYGPGATVLTGEVARIGQNPLISSIAMALANTAGKVSTTGGNNLYGSVAAFNRRGYVVGWRRRVQLETERLPGRDQTRLIYSLRMGLGRFSPTGAASGIEHSAVLYYIAV